MGFGAWPPFRDSAGGGASSSAPALLPAGYAGMFAQYSLLNTVAGVDVDDRSGNGNASLSQPGNVRLPDAVPGRTSFVPESYPGYSIGLAAPSAQVLRPGLEMTVMARVACQATYVPNYQIVVTQAQRPTQQTQYALAITPTGQVAAYWQGAGPDALFAAGPDVRDGAWHVVGFTRDATGSVARVYVDGALVGTSASMTAVALNATCGFYIAQNSMAGNIGGAGEWLFGQVADVNLAHVALTDAQMLAAANTMLGA